MKYDPDKQHRRSIRLKEYNYSRPGAYFITICTKNRIVLFNHDHTKSIIQKWWDSLPLKFPNVLCDQFMIMPNHIHGIILVSDASNAFVGADQSVCPHKRQSNSNSLTTKSDEHIGSPLHKPSLGRIVQWFKR